MKRWLSLFVLAVVLALSMPTQASAQSCSALATNMRFGSVSPISRGEFPATSTVTVTCTWPATTQLPSAQICLNVGRASPRQLLNGTNQLLFDLYSDPGHSLVWGSTSHGTTPVSFTMTKPATGTSTTQVVTMYGRISPDQPAVRTVNNADTVYTQVFFGSHTSLNVRFYPQGTGGPCSAQATGGTFGFDVGATVINNCNISATNITFTSIGLLDTALTANGAITAQCTNGNAYKITLNGGANGTLNDRKMMRSGGGATLGYELYTDTQFTTPWGDGTLGTSPATNTGTGDAQVISVYGRVPAQSTPAPGTYTDTVTATINF